MPYPFTVDVLALAAPDEPLFLPLVALGELSSFTYVTAVTFIKGNKQTWEKCPRFVEAMKGNPILLLSLEDILTHLNDDLSTTVAASAIGRTLQLMRAAQKGKKAMAKEVQAQMPVEENDPDLEP
jgi:hypothetical protein